MQKTVSKFTKTVLGISLGLAILLTFGSVGLNIYFAHEASEADQERRESSNALAALQDEYQGLYMEYTEAVGGEPEAATPSQVNDAVEQATPGPVGATGATGANGRAPTAAEIGAAVRAYCAVLNQCIGERGQDGSDGEPGETGAPGADGEDGSAGADGANGLNGARGSDGSNGVNGAKGEAGAAGAAGAQGPAGPKGETGAIGPVGPAGPPGPEGASSAGVTGVSCIMDGLTSYFVFSGPSGEISRVQGSCIP